MSIVCFCGSFKSTVKRLQQLKMEIEHLQHLLELSRVKLMKDFDVWWSDQEHLAQTQASYASAPGARFSQLPKLPQNFLGLVKLRKISNSQKFLGKTLEKVHKKLRTAKNLS